MSAGRVDAPQRRIPRGVILIATLLIVMAFFALGMGLLIPTRTLAQADLNRSLLLAFALVTGILAYGLLRMRRWAWAATLSFVFVQGYFIVLNALLDGTSQAAGLILLACVGLYLLLPKVRGVFLQPRQS